MARFIGLSDTPCPPRSRPFVLAVTIAASAMAFIDGTLVSIAIPVIEAELHADIADMQWVSTGYLLMLGALMLIGGGLGDRIGRRRVFLVGITVFTVSSVACALAPTVAVLVAARIAQGVGAALLVPQSLALIAANFPEEIRGRAIGTWAAASAITMALGPAVGGFLIDLSSWRAVFWVNVPIALVAVGLTLLHVPESRNEEARGPIDWPGAALATLGIGAVTYGLVGLGDTTAALWPNLLAIVVGGGLVILFVIAERRAANPVMPPDLFRSRIFTVSNVVTLLLYGALSGSLFLLPFDLMTLRGLDAAEVGLLLLPFGLIIGVLSRPMGALADTHGPRLFMTLGPLLVAIGCAGLALSLANLWVGVVAPVVVMAVGMGIVVSPLTTAVMNAAPSHRSGAASGISNAASRLAGVLAVAITGAVASSVYLSAAPAGVPSFGVLPAADAPERAGAAAAFATSYATSMAIVAVWALAATAIAWLTIPKGRPSAAH